MHDVEPPDEPCSPTRRARRAGFEPALPSQPFRVRLHPEVPFVLDLHAHLSNEEVVGFLAGRWDSETGVLDIQAAFPCRALPTGEHSSLKVDIDPGKCDVLVLQESLLPQFCHALTFFPIFWPQHLIYKSVKSCNEKTCRLLAGIVLVRHFNQSHRLRTCRSR